MANHLVMTKAALFAKKAEEDLKVVTFESYKSKKKSNDNKLLRTEDSTAKKADVRKGIDIQRARREIIKFGISGFSAKKQEDINVAHAISLGAKPPKGERKNYKELKNEKLKQKQLEMSNETFETGKNKLGVSTAMKNYKKNVLNGQNKKGNILKIYGKATIDKNAKTKPMDKKKVHKKGKR